MEPHRSPSTPSSSSAEMSTASMTYKSLSRSDKRGVEVDYDDGDDDDDDGGIEVIDLRPQPLLKREIGGGTGGGTSADDVDLEISSSSNSRSSGGSSGDGIRPSILKTVTGYIIATGG